MKSLIFCFLIGFALTVATRLPAQPLLSSKKMVGERLVFRDLKDKNKYYFGPGKLSLSKEPDGKPAFQLLSLRYTGTAATGDVDKKRFTNLLQFTISMPALNQEQLKTMRQELGIPAKAELLPVPIRHLESVVVAGVRAAGNPDGEKSEGWHKKVSGSLGEGKTGEGGVYWTERTFVLQLNNAEAQLLWGQQAKGRVALSLNYAFYADMVVSLPESVQVSGDSVFVRSFNESAQIQQDTQLILQAILGGALDIQVDAIKWPDALKKIDINETSIPPAYAALEVKCFDFANQLRPDLAFKRVEIEGASLGGGNPITIRTRFLAKSPDLTNQFVSFPYAVRMDKPIRYRYFEMPVDGEPYISPWYTIPPGSNLVDVTTPEKENPVQLSCLEVETDPTLISAESADLEVYFVYWYSGKQSSQLLFWTGGNPLQNVCIAHDKSQPLRYFTRRKTEGGKTFYKSGLRPVPMDGYLFLGK